jgi:PKD repeat protein
MHSHHCAPAAAGPFFIATSFQNNPDLLLFRIRAKCFIPDLRSSGFLARIAVMALLLVLISSAFAQTTVTLQNGTNNYTGTTDDWIVAFSGADLNEGTYPDLPIRSADTDRSIIRFAIFTSEGGPVPTGATITSATLSLYKYDGPDAVIQATRLLKNWTETGATWNTTGTGTPWSVPGASGTGTDVASSADGQASIADATANNCTAAPFPAACWLNIDVTTGVRAFSSGTPNYGWLLTQVSSSAPGNYKNFDAKDNNNFPALRPKLTITYQSSTTNSGNSSPTAVLTASPTSGAAPLAVTFSAAGSTQGSAPITSLVLAFGDGSANVTWTDKTQTQSHTFASGGTFPVKLTVTDSNGGSAVVLQSITATGSQASGPRAQLTATPTSGTAPLAVSFNASGSTQGSAPITSLRLHFNDNSQDIIWTDKTQTQSHTFSSPGSYIATFTVTDSNGVTATSQQPITVTGSTGACVNSPLPASGVAIATFHSMSLYYNPANAPSGDQIFVRYRLATDDPSAPGFTWKQGHPLWYDNRNDSNGQPLHPYRGRGSVVHLQPNTKYVFEVGMGASYATATWLNHIPDGQSDCPSTWSETFPVGTTLTPWTGTNTTTTSSTYLGQRSSSARQQVLLANQSGTPSGYTVYDFTGTNAVAQTSNSSNFFPVVISGSYIILKGLKVVGGESGIFIDPGSHDIVIDNVDISGYSRDCGTPLGAGLTGNRACNEDAGIKFPDQTFGPVLDTKRIIIQHSKIHNPAFGSNPWDVGHPVGASSILMYPTGGQIVIRYNESYSTTNGVLGGPPDVNHYHGDGLIAGGCNIKGDSNCSQQGIGPDVDIYKNVVMNYFDDALETDGDGTNNRVWKNYLDYGGASGISTTPTYVGPVYVWRNVYNRQRECFSNPWGNETCNGGGRDSMMKAGGIDIYDGGRRYLYHNTSLQAPFTSEASATGPNPLGAGTGVEDTGSATPLMNTVSRNNVFEIWKSNWAAFTFNSTASGNDLDYDLSNGVMSEAHGLASTTPQYQTGNGWSSYWNGKYRLVPGTPGYDDGLIIPNFNDGFLGAGPDRGAHEDGTPDMDFGTKATGH